MRRAGNGSSTTGHRYTLNKPGPAPGFLYAPFHELFTVERLWLYQLLVNTLKPAIPHRGLFFAFNSVVYAL